jgi:secreted trypsin-like serine protease
MRLLPLALVLALAVSQGCRRQEPSLSEPKIVGGEKAGYQPFMVAIRDAKDNAQFCGGSWIAEGVIVTAAHCLYGQTPKLSVTVGSADKDDYSPATTFRVRSAVMHPDFNPERDMKNDIALLFIDPVDHTGLPRPVTPIKVNMDRNVPRAGDMVTPIGWGNETSFGAMFGQDLKQVEVPVVPIASCRTGGKYYSMIEDDFEICAGDFDQGGSDACQGDSGGPLTATVNGQQILVGIVSWGIDCAQKKHPGVYTRISKHTDWIKQEIAAFKNPAAAEAGSLAKAVAGACYASFAGTDVISGVPYRFNFQPDQLAKSLSVPGHGRSLRNCSFNREGLGQVNVFVAPVDDKPTFFVKQAGDTWVGAARSTFEFDTDCTSGGADFQLSKYSTSVALIYNDEKLLSSGISSLPAGAAGTTVSCANEHVQLTYKTFAAGSGRPDRRFLTVTFPKADTGVVTYAMDPDPEALESGSSLQVSHRFLSDTKAEIEFRHRGDLDIYSWALSCPFKYQLTGSDGRTHKPEDGTPGAYRIAFHHSLTRSAVITKGTGVKFTMTFNSPATPEKLENCTVNDMPLDVE